MYAPLSPRGPPLAEAQRAKVAVLFGPYLDSLGKRPDRRS